MARMSNKRRLVFLYLISKGCENMEKSLEQLKQECEKTAVLLEREKRKMQRLKNRQSYLESGSRKQRMHRLLTRGAAVGKPRLYFRAGERR